MIHYYRGMMTDGIRKSTNIFDLKPKGISEKFIKNPKSRPWYETPFTNIRFIEPANIIPAKLQAEQKPFNGTLDEFILSLRETLSRYWLSVLKEDEKYLCFHSGGYDSRVMSMTLMELRDAGYDNLTKNVHFRCHQPEEPMFLEIMRRQGWDKSQYSVYEGPKEDYYDIGRMDRPLNGWQHYNQQMNFWSDLGEDFILITGLGGEMFKYVGQGITANRTFVKNNLLNMLIDHYPHQGQWEGYWRSVFKDLLLPFWSYEYMSLSTRVNPKWCSWDDIESTDSVRVAIVESFVDTHGVDCRNIEYGRHDYSWNISDKRKADMLSNFYASKFYRDCGDMLPADLDFFSVEPKRWYYDSFLWGFMTCYERMAI